MLPLHAHGRQNVFPKQAHLSGLGEEMVRVEELHFDLGYIRPSFANPLTAVPLSFSSPITFRAKELLSGHDAISPRACSVPHGSFRSCAA
jgi:hypothetical protein